MAHRGLAFWSHHLFVVISDPKRDPSRVVVVNVTSCKTREDHGRLDVIRVGEHPSISVPSYVALSRAKVLPAEALDKNLAKVSLAPDSSSELLSRICRSAASARELPIAARQALADQGLV